MKTRNPQIGRSRKGSLSARLREEARRFLSLALSVCMVASGIPAIPALAATSNTSIDVQEFEVMPEDLQEALEYAMREGTPISERAYRFSGVESEVYEDLFYSEDVYELTSDVKVEGPGRLNLRIFARTDGDQNLDSYRFTGNEEIIFLLLNKTDEERTARIYFGNYETELITVAARSGVEFEKEDTNIDISYDSGAVGNADIRIESEAVTEEGDIEESVVEVDEISEESSDKEKLDENSDSTEVDNDSEKDSGIEDDKSSDSESDSDDDSASGSSENESSDKSDNTSDDSESNDKSENSEKSDDNEKSDNSEKSDDNNRDDAGRDHGRGDRSEHDDRPERNDRSDRNESSGDNGRSANSSNREKETDKGENDSGSKRSDNSERDHSSDSASISANRVGLLSASIDDTVVEIESDDSGDDDDVEEVVDIVIAEENEEYEDPTEDDAGEESVTIEEIEMVKASASDADEEEGTGGNSRIPGEIYDAVMVNGRRSAVAFVTTVEDLGLKLADVEVATEDDQTVKAQIYRDSDYEFKLSDGTSITLEGVMPFGAEAKAYPVEIEIDDIHVLAAYDITIFNKDGDIYEPEDDNAIEVTIDNDEIRDALADDRELTVFHMVDVEDEPETIATIPPKARKARFMADHFSIYIVGEDDQLVGETRYTFEFYQYVFDDEEATHTEEPISTQKVLGTDKLEQPATPEIDGHVFDGWFTQVQEKDHEYLGYQLDFSKTVQENLVSWEDYEISDDKVIKLYSDYDPVFYVYFYTEEFDDKGDPIESDVFYTDEYYNNTTVLDTSYADSRYLDMLLEEYEQDDDGEHKLEMLKAVTDWYYYDNGNPVYISSQDGGFIVTGHLELYPVVEDAIWIVYSMQEADASVQSESKEPTYVLASAEKLSEDNVASPNVWNGYTFDGWYLEDTYETQVTSDTDPENLFSIAAGNGGFVYFYAKWSVAPAGYDVRIWRQKATDGKEGLDQQKVEDGEPYDDYVKYYDYVSTIAVSGDESEIYSGTELTPDMLEENGYFYEYTTYGTTDSSDQDDDYFGFEYNKDRTGNDLSDKVMEADGSTIINIFYDREIVTWIFLDYGSSSNESNNTLTSQEVKYTLKGLYGTNVDLEDGDQPEDCYYHFPSSEEEMTVTDGETYTYWRFSSYNGSSRSQTLINPQPQYCAFTTNCNGNDLTDNEPFNVIFWLRNPSTYGETNTYYETLTPDSDSVQLQDKDYRLNRNSLSPSSTVAISGTSPTGMEIKYVTSNTNLLELKESGNAEDGGTVYAAGTVLPIAPGDQIGNSRSNRYQFTDEEAGTYDSEVAIRSFAKDDVVNLYYDLAEFNIDFVSNGNEYKSYTYFYTTPLDKEIFPTYEMMNTAAEEDESLRPGTWYYFDAWYSDADYVVKVPDADFPETMPANNLAYYANWEPYIYSVKFDLADGSDPQTQSVTAGGTAVEPVIPDRENEGYEFVCWRDQDWKIFNVNTAVYKDYELTAVWQNHNLESFTLTYDLNLDGDHSQYEPENQNFTVGGAEELITVEAAFADISGEQYSKFICWNTEPDGSGTNYYPEGEYYFYPDNPGMTESGNITLYAIWAVEIQAKLTLNYNYPDGYNAGTSQVDVETANLENIVLDDVSGLEEGDTIKADSITYKFLGWSTTQYDSDDLYEDPDNDAVEYTADKTVAVNGDDNVLYAVWIAVDPQKKVDGSEGSDVKVGDRLTYTITYYNNTDITVEVIITDVLDEGLDFIDASDGGNYDPVTHTVTWTISPVEKDKYGSVTLTVEVNETADTEKEIANTAHIEFRDFDNDVSIDEEDTNDVVIPVEDTEPVKSVDTTGNNDFSDDGKTVSLNDELNYKIEFTNYSEYAANVTITDELDEGLTYVSSSDGGNYDAETRVITWNVELGSDRTGYVTFKATVNRTGRSNGVVTNYAEVAVQTLDPYGVITLAADGEAATTNTVTNPVAPASSSSSGRSGGGGSGSGSSGSSGSVVGGPGDSGSSDGDSEGDVWSLNPLAQTGQGNGMLFGACALAISAMALIVLLKLRRKEN